MNSTREILALVEVGEVDARAEDAPARVLVVRCRGAAQDTHADAAVEQNEIDGDLERGGRDVISEFRNAWFCTVTWPMSPSRSTRIGPRSALPSRWNSSSRASASAVGCDIEWIRWKPARG